MSERLTSDWAPNSEGAFGEHGKEGDDGELLAVDLFDNLRIGVRHNPSNRDKQVGGKDIEILTENGWVGIDVKTNIHNDGNPDVCIEYNKLKDSKAKYWLHINPDDHLNDYIIYPVKSMIEVARAFTPRGKDKVRWVPKDIARNLK